MKTTKVRGFELVSKEQYESTDATVPYEKLELPKRATKRAAGYDIKSTKAFTLKPGEDIVIPTGLKSYMQVGEMLALFPRSGMGFKYQIQLANTVGIGDGDYYNCESNEGHYFIKLVNRGSKDWVVKEGDGVGQGIFLPILLADGDDFETGEERTGGFGSTDKVAQQILSSKAKEMGYSDMITNTPSEVENRGIEKTLFDVFESSCKELLDSYSDDVELDILDNIKTKLTNNEFDMDCRNLLSHLLGKDKLKEVIYTIENSNLYKELNLNITNTNEVKSFIDNTTVNIVTSHEDAALGMPVLISNSEEDNILSIGNICHIGETSNSILVSGYHKLWKEEFKRYYLDSDDIKVFEYIGGDSFHNLKDFGQEIKGGDFDGDVINVVKLGATGNNETNINYSDEVKELLGQDNLNVLRDSNRVILGYVELSDFNQPRRVATYLRESKNRDNIMIAKDVHNIYKSYTLEPGTFMFIDMYPVRDVAHCLKGTDSLKVSICVYDYGHLLLVDNVSDKAVTFECKDFGINGTDMPMLSNGYFKTDNLVKLNSEEIKNLKFGDLVVGVESYGPKLRFVSGMVGEVHESYVYIMANDNYHGARGTHIDIEDYPVYKLSDEDILSTEFINKVKSQREEGNRH